MSVKVNIDELADHLRHYGLAYLVTVGDDQRAHVVGVRPTLDGPTIEVAGLGRGSRANLEARPDTTLVWPPFEHGGYTLIVDGRASLSSTGVSIVPGHAVLHRPADDGSHDCVPVGEG